MTKDKPETKRFTDAIDLDSGKKLGSEFVIPRFTPKQGEGFIGLETGKSYANAAICYIGMAITADDVLERYLEHNNLSVTTDTATNVLDRYILALQGFELGNVLSIEYTEDNSFRKRSGGFPH
jgi:hypothetical protein